MLDQISYFMNTMLVVMGALLFLGTLIGAAKYGIGFLKQMIGLILVLGFIVFIVWR